MTAPKPPTPRSVSATLRTAGFAAAQRIPPPGMYKLSEGYRAEWQQGEGSPVVVSFITDGAYVHEQALSAMTETLTRKGWSVRKVEDMSRPGRLIVKER